MIRKIRSKVTEKEAVQWLGTNADEVFDFMGKENMSWHLIDKSLYVHTLEGPHKASAGDWIIKGLRGEFYPCKPDIFEKSYEFID